MEPCITDCKACKFPSVAVTVPTAFYSCLDKSMLEELLVEELGMAT